MRNIFKTILFFLLFIVFLSFPNNAFAVCPICTVAVGAGLGISRWLGIDDTITSIWIGGLILSSSFWIIDWFKKKNINLKVKYSDLLIIFFMYLFVLVPLWFGKIIGNPMNTILGTDKIIFGTIIGSFSFLLGMWIDKKIRKIKGKQLFSYQKVLFPLLSLVIVSIIIYYYGGYLY